MINMFQNPRFYNTNISFVLNIGQCKYQLSFSLSHTHTHTHTHTHSILFPPNCGSIHCRYLHEACIIITYITLYTVRTGSVYNLVSFRWCSALALEINTTHTKTHVLPPIVFLGESPLRTDQDQQWSTLINALFHIMETGIIKYHIANKGVTHYCRWAG